MRNKRINIALITLLILGILIVGQASYRELLYGGVCANFTIIPTCYVALVYLILLLINIDFMVQNYNDYIKLNPNYDLSYDVDQSVYGRIRKGILILKLTFSRTGSRVNFSKKPCW